MEPPRQVNVAPIAPYISQAQPGEQRLAPEGFQPRPSLPGAAVGPSGSAYAAPPRAASSGDFVTAALAGLGIAVGSVVIWCVLAYTTGYSIGYLAIFTGLLIGRTMMKLRGGPDETTALTAVGLTALSILVGAFMAAVFAVMKVSGAPFGDSLSLGVDDPVGAIMPSNPLMFLAYGIALLVAYRSATGKTKRRF